jgi:hypothetical protein
MQNCTHPATAKPTYDANPNPQLRKQIGQVAICTCCQAGIDTVNRRFTRR